MKRWSTPLLALLLGVFFYWSWTLFGNFGYRAFDTADPLMELVNAQPALMAARTGQWQKVPAALMEDEKGKPLLNTLLFLGPATGVSDGLSHHYRVTGFFALCFFLIAAVVIGRLMSSEAAIVFAVLCAGSNLMNEYSLAGGHNWIGQTFLWGSFLFFPGHPLLAGISLALGVLGSYHIIPLAGMTLLAWSVHSYFFNSDKKEWAPVRALAGFAGLLFTLTLITLPFVKRSYFQILSQNIFQAGSSAGKFPAGPKFFPSLLWQGESALFLGLLMALAGFGAYQLRQKHKEVFPLTLLAVPIVVLSFLEFSGTLKLGRIYIPLMPFFFAWAAYGAQEILQRLIIRYPSVIPAKAGIQALPIFVLCLILFFSGISLRNKTHHAFHAGKAIEKITQGQNAVTVGFHLPFSYLPKEEQRTFIDPKRLIQDRTGKYFYLPVTSERPFVRADFDAAVKAGARWVLLSYYSSWDWQSFIEDEDPSVIPAKAFYQSQADCREIPGVEGLPYHVFSNEAIYAGIRQGRLKAYLPNRLCPVETVARIPLR